MNNISRQINMPSKVTCAPISIVLIVYFVYTTRHIIFRSTKHIWTKKSFLTTKFLRVYNLSSNVLISEAATFILNRSTVTKFQKRVIFAPSTFQKKDWHNYTLIKEEEKRVGIGEQGKAVLIPKEEESTVEKIVKLYRFNAPLSDKIPLNRSLPDIRHPKCKDRLYLESLPTVSIIITFHNEYWSTLLRTIYSVLNRSPEQLIKELILVDDASTTGNYKRDVLKSNLENYVEKHITKLKVMLLRLPTRSGIVKARLTGVKAATADVLVFLDSHVEANVNWLPPLLEPIALNYRTIVVPIIDHIDSMTLEYTAMDEGARGVFEWTLSYIRMPKLPKDEQNMPEPYDTPIMMGGLFAMSRHFFWDLGGYDIGLTIWGSEELELSFKTWQCGGRILEAPCSRFGHIFGDVMHPEPVPGYGNYLVRNMRRVAEVWMDEYAEFLYARKPFIRTIDPGDLTQQKALRKKLKCKSFRWFMTQVAFDLTQRFPAKEPEVYAKGRIRVHSSQNEQEMCVDVPIINKESYSLPVLEPCHQDTMVYILGWFNDIEAVQNPYLCFDLIDDPRPRVRVVLSHCHRNGGSQQWRYYDDSKKLVHNSGLCLDHKQRAKKLFLSVCKNNAETQMWDIDYVYKNELEKWNASHTVRVTGPVEEWKE